ncbi:aldehyde dehydrogenase family protein [Modestobacter sp. VKM Ac-2977]|uniref:aldehyde dehydrogenase family protein n=1 Tax=Modestobacter sp. VKM Ac-2977 TaxID=3004131 RepID=UPI0022AAAB39|nr:aldehyde dehydrogenase family protein [Modestobacter sp. VKM Ac-2977]MCZ2820095.1 aldehyde dehydrogenase family protein [Modestobacter sp. VKM Ac-2977]
MASDNSAPAPYDGFDRMPIAGTWRAGRAGKTATDTNPYTGETLTEIPLANADDLDEAYARAKEAQRDWAARLPSERADVMRRAARVMEDRKDEIVDWHIKESGAAAPAAAFEYAITLRDFHEASSYPYRVEGRILPADIEGKESRVYRRPVGVVAVISPWNVPMHLSNRSVAPALATGNAVVLKPAGDTPVTGGLLLAKVYEEAGLPEGLLSVLIGSGSDIGDAIVAHPTPRVVSFTGSTPVGKGIAEKAGLKKLSLELGGNGPLVVLDDADVGYAVDAAVFGKFFHQGQVCMITNRIIVDDAVHDEFVERYVERVRGLKAGDPAEADTVIGPIINAKQLEGIQEKVAQSIADGAQQLLGGDPTGPIGSVLPPHVLLGSNEVTSARTEMFGPVATIIRARDEDDALAIANDTEYGLSSAVFTEDTLRGVQFALRVEAGMTHVNDSPLNDENNTAFGGEKDSGLGRFGGDWAIEEFTTDHWVSVQHTKRKFPF